MECVNLESRLLEISADKGPADNIIIYFKQSVEIVYYSNVSF